MLFLSRAAALAALALSLVGIAQSAPGVAAELDRTAIAAAAPAPAVTGTDTGLTTAAATTLPPVTLTPAIATDTDVVASAPDKFDSLADAVAAQDAAVDQAVVDGDLRCLASAIYFEAKGEPMAGQLAVAQVIINRARSGRFASDLCGVVTQRGQFSFVHAGAIPTIDPSRPSYRTALAVAKVALTQAWSGGAEGALFFHARRVAPAGRFVRVAAIGNHVFYR